MTHPFLWGVATSSYQIEGASENDWTQWERQERLKARGERCGEAAGHRSRWRADFDLLPTLGANAYRLSVERSAVEPEPGFFSDEALRLERDRVDSLARLGVEPVVTRIRRGFGRRADGRARRASRDFAGTPRSWPTPWDRAFVSGSP
jgi:beta-glucosidase